MPLIGWWRFDGNADDSIRSIDGTAHNISWINGKIGQAADMNASGRFIEVPHNYVLSSRVFGYATIFSLSAWVYAYEWSNHSLIIGKATGASWSNTTAALWVHSAGVRFVIGSNESGNPSGSSTGPSFAPTLNEWHHVVGVADGVNLLLYVDGELVGTGDISAVTRERSENTAPITIGRRSVGITGDYFDGYIDDLRVYDHALSFKEVKHLFRAKTGHWVPEESYVRDKGHWGNHGQNNGATLTTDTPIGERAYEFNGIDQSLRLTNSIKNKEGTIAFWVYIDPNQSWADAFRLFRTSPGTSAGRVLMYMNGTNRLRVIYYLVEANINAYFNNANQAITGRWAHIAVTFADGDSPNRGVKIYADGVQVGNGNVAETNTSNSDSVVHVDMMREYGSATAATFCEGKMTDIKIFAEVLSAEDIQELAQQRASLDSSGNYFAHLLEETSKGYIRAAHYNDIEGAPFNIFSDGDTTYSPDYIYNNTVTFDTSQWVKYNFYAPEDGTYTIRAFINAWSGGNDSFFMSVDNEPFVDWHTGQNADWFWSTWTNRMLTKGNHNLRIAPREATKMSVLDIFSGDTQVVHSKHKVSKQGVTAVGAISEVGVGHDLAAWYKLDGAANDLVGQNHGTVFGSVTWPSSEMGIVAEFDGSSYIDTGISNVYHLFCDSGTRWSVAAWFKYSSSTGMIVGAGGGTGSSATFGLYVTSSANLTTRLRGALTTIAGGMDDGNWHHCVITWDGTTAKAYLDGVFVMDLNVGTVSRQVYDATIGATAGGSNTLFVGLIHDVRFYDSALSSQKSGILHDMTGLFDQKAKKATSAFYLKGHFDEVSL